MTCHCGNCEDHRVDRWKMFDREEKVEFPPAPGGWQWSNGISEEAKKAIEESLKSIVKEQAPASLEELAWATVNENTGKAVALNTQEGRDRYDEQYYANIEAPDPYKQWLENTDYMSKEEIADRYARFGMALQEIHTMALDSFSGKPLPEAKYMLGLCLGLAGGALNYERPNFEK